jgi:hypothetical protein
MANITAILEAIQKRRSFGEKLADKMGGEPLLKDPEAMEKGDVISLADRRAAISNNTEKRRDSGGILTPEEFGGLTSLITGDMPPVKRNWKEEASAKVGLVAAAYPHIPREKLLETLKGKLSPDLKQAFKIHDPEGSYKHIPEVFSNDVKGPASGKPLSAVPPPPAVKLPPIPKKMEKGDVVDMGQARRNKDERHMKKDPIRFLQDKLATGELSYEDYLNQTGAEPIDKSPMTPDEQKIYDTTTSILGKWAKESSPQNPYPHGAIGSAINDAGWNPYTKKFGDKKISDGKFVPLNNQPAEASTNKPRHLSLVKSLLSKIKSNKPTQEIRPVAKTFEQKASQDIQNFRDKVEDGENLQKPPISEAQRAFMAVAAQRSAAPERAEKTQPMPVPLRDSAALPQSMEKGLNEYSDEALSAAKLTSGSRFTSPEMKQKYTKALVEGKNHGVEFKGRLASTEQGLRDDLRRVKKEENPQGTGGPDWGKPNLQQRMMHHHNQTADGGNDFFHLDPVDRNTTKVTYSHGYHSPDEIISRFGQFGYPIDANESEGAGHGSVTFSHNHRYFNPNGERMQKSVQDPLNKSVIGKLKAMVPLASLACGAGGCGSKIQRSGDYQKTSVEGNGPVKTECYRNHEQVPCEGEETPLRPTLQGTSAPTPAPVQKADDAAADMQSDISAARTRIDNSVVPAAGPNIPPLNLNPNTQPAPTPTPTFDQNLSASAFGSAPAGLQKASPSKIHEDKSIKEANGTQEAADVKAGPLNATKLKAIISSHKEMTARLNQNFNPSVARGVACKEEYIDRAKAQEKSGTGAVYSGENSGKSPEARSKQLHEKKEKMNPQIVEPMQKAIPGQQAFNPEFYDKVQSDMKPSKPGLPSDAKAMLGRMLKNPIGSTQRDQPIVADDAVSDAPSSHLVGYDNYKKAQKLEHSADFPPTGMSKIHHIINKVKGSSPAEPMEKGVRESVNNFVAPKPDSKPGMVTDARRALTTPIGSGADQLIDRRPKTAMALAALAAGNIVGANAAAWNHLKAGMYKDNAAIQNSRNDYQKEQYDAQMNKKIQPQRMQKSVSSLQKAKEMLAGGKADGIPDSAFDRRSLRQGQKIEQEHTSNPKTALEIAKDHLAEHGSQYYPKLKQMEGSMEKASDTPEVKREGKDNSKVVGKVVLGEKGEWHWAKEGEEGIPVRKQHGYYRVTGGEYRGRYLHSIVTEKKIGRKLKDGEEVDHMNGDRSDTKNLKVLSIGEHTSKTNKTRGDEGSGPKKYAHSKDDNH